MASSHTPGCPRLPHRLCGRDAVGHSVVFAAPTARAGCSSSYPLSHTHHDLVTEANRSTHRSTHRYTDGDIVAKANRHFYADSNGNTHAVSDTNSDANPDTDSDIDALRHADAATHGHTTPHRSSSLSHP